MSKDLQKNIYLLFIIPPLILAILFFIYSYFWIDHRLLTFLAADKPELGYFYKLIEFTSNNKVLMAQWYLLLIILLFISQVIFFIPKIYNSIPGRPLLFFLGLITILFSLAYPFLSKDIFYYYISAKMAYFYHLNPYTTAPVDLIGKDFFVLVSHNIRAPYLYGQLFLVYSIIPMLIVGAQKIIMYFLLLKLMNGFLFFLCGLLLFKLSNQDKRLYAIWFLNPFLLIEWLSNTHNDVVMITLFVIGYYFFIKKKLLAGLIFLISSVFIKYVTILAMPVFILNSKWRQHFLKIVGLTIPYFVYFAGVTIQPWYSTWSYLFLPLTRLRSVTWLLFFVIGFISLVNYYRFLESSGWGAGYLIPYPNLLTNLLIVVSILFEYLPKLRVLKIKNDH